MAASKYEFRYAVFHLKIDDTNETILLNWHRAEKSIVQSLKPALVAQSVSREWQQPLSFPKNQINLNVSVKETV